MRTLTLIYLVAAISGLSSLIIYATDSTSIMAIIGCACVSTFLIALLDGALKKLN